MGALVSEKGLGWAHAHMQTPLRKFVRRRAGKEAEIQIGAGTGYKAEDGRWALLCSDNGTKGWIRSRFFTEPSTPGLSPLSVLPAFA